MAELTVRRLTPTDLLAADRLREQAGWNQTLEDWQRLLRWEPDGCFVSCGIAGEVNATVTTTIYAGSPRLAWVGMMLVDERLRRQGRGRTMLLTALDFLAQRDVPLVALDATPLGKTLYDHLGFVDGYTLQRREARVPAVEHSADADGVRPFSVKDVSRVAEIDNGAFFGADRLRVLQDLLLASGGGGWLMESGDGTVDGYVVWRPGARAWYIGPLVARDRAIAERLLRAALTPLAGQLAILDAPDPPANQQAAHLAEAYGFEPRRPFIRMTRGMALPEARTDWCYAIAGPELG